ncbi:MAG TPA: GAF domain-containing protein [Ferruginibacter sp.]|nr:GAF domain-containing protein [Ferruginibacter sp.]
MKGDPVELAIRDARQMLGDGASVKKILTLLVNAAEKVMGEDTVSSILVLDKDGLLRNGASPRLPNDYLKAIDGLKPDPNLGTCASVAATGIMVITPDFQADDKWAELRHLPLALGFYSAWSVPIKSQEGKVLGTFGTYFRDKKVPRQTDIDAVNYLAVTAAEALVFKR